MTRVKNFEESVEKEVRDDVRRRLAGEGLPQDPYDFDAVTGKLSTLCTHAEWILHPDTSEKLRTISREDYERTWSYALSRYRRTLDRNPDAAATHRNKDADEGDQLDLL